MYKWWTPAVFFFYFTGKGILHVKSIWKDVTFNPIRCFSFLCQGVSRLKNWVITRTGTSDELSYLIEESNWRTSQKYLSSTFFTMPPEISRSRWLKHLELSLTSLWLLWDFSMTFHCNYKHQWLSQRLCSSKRKE